jgi:RimJ/RimL family protein N-acetyltransferase
METRIKISFSPIDERQACEIARWRYPPPYDLYNLAESKDAIAYALDPQNNFYAMEDKQGELVGFCSFGQDGQVPGGDYAADALDIGLGIHPDLTGQGKGIDYVSCVLDFARETFDPPRFRVTIAVFNRRAQRVWRKAGFWLVNRFRHEETGRAFVILVKDT